MEFFMKMCPTNHEKAENNKRRKEQKYHTNKKQRKKNLQVFGNTPSNKWRWKKK